MGAQLAAAPSHSSHCVASVIGWVPSQVPCVAVSVWPIAAVPVRTPGADGALHVYTAGHNFATRLSGIEMLRRSRPDVALLDVRMPRADGIAVLRELGADANPTRCIVLTTFDDADAFLAAVRAGARGYLLKDASPQELGEAIRAVAAGGTWFKPAVSDTVLRGLASLQTGETPER